MAQGRFLSKSVAFDTAVASLSGAAREVYLMTIPHLDVDGITTGKPEVLWAMACPLLIQYRDSMKGIITEWVDAGLVVAYLSEGNPALFFKGFPKNQKVRRDREASSEYTDPPGYERDDSGALVRSSAGVLQESSGSTQEFANTSISASASASISASVSVSEGQDAPASPDLPTDTRNRLRGILEQQWPTGIGKTQWDAHCELVERYGFDGWKAGWDRTKPGARSNARYLEKAIISARDEPAPVQRKSKVDASMDAVDAVYAKLEKEGIDAWQ